MELKFEVKRKRGSVTQGEATVLLNGQEVITFADSITFTAQNRGAEYGDIIGDWQSCKPDSDFIKGVLFPFYTNEERIKARILEILRFSENK